MHSTGGVCPYVCGLVNRACDREEVDALILTTVCDQMRHVHCLVEQSTTLPAFLMNVPATWRQPSARALYESEMDRISRFLVGLGGVRPSDTELARVMVDFEDRRVTLRASRKQRSARAFSEAVACFPRTPAGPAEAVVGSVNSSGTPIALIGGPLPAADYTLFDLIDEAGGSVVLDGTETGERTLPGSPRSERVALNPLRELAAIYFDAIPDIWRRPNDAFYQWLDRAVGERGVRGVVLVHWVWCDLWKAEVERVREALAVPLLDVDLNGDELEMRNRTRIEAFLESLGTLS